jgi:hypothetical protein
MPPTAGQREDRLAANFSERCLGEVRSMSLEARLRSSRTLMSMPTYYQRAPLRRGRRWVREPILRPAGCGAA